MKIFLAAVIDVDKDFYDYYKLESFITLVKKPNPHLARYKDFMLDSGAFTYLNGAKGDINWDEYIDRYADFINKYKVKNFIELDIDPIVGLKEVERLRAKLEAKVGRQSIPVWHKSRGKQYWLDMVREYDYVAIGGIVTREIKPSEYKYFHWLLAEAKKQNCKVHGLGFTNLKGLEEYDFYSVDSTTWLNGSKYGELQFFNGKTITKIARTHDKRAIPEMISKHNFYEWVKFANYKDGV